MGVVIKAPMGSDEVLSSRTELLPGIPDSVTLEQIVPKLPWRAVHMLSAISRSWRRAIQSREVYDARVRSRSTETVLIGNYMQSSVRRIAVCSMRDETYFQLPDIASLLSGVPSACQCISVNGRIYILGGYSDWLRTGVSAKVYVFDLAGQGKWRQCASMQEPRTKFGCGVKEGKIYVSGGVGETGKHVYLSEVYDPEANAWSPMMPPEVWRRRPGVITVGDELVVHGGTDQFDSRPRRRYQFGNLVYAGKETGEASEEAEFCLAKYHPVKDERGLGQDVPDYSRLETVFMSKGKFHFMTGDAIYVQDVETDLWHLQHSFSLAAVGSPDFRPCGKPSPVAVIDDELVVIVWFVSTIQWGDRRPRRWLLRSRGLHSKDIVWQKALASHPFSDVFLTGFLSHIFYFLRPMQL